MFILANGILNQSALWNDQAFWSASKLCYLPLAGLQKGRLAHFSLLLLNQCFPPEIGLWATSLAIITLTLV